jgi:hypothetical protein
MRHANEAKYRSRNSRNYADSDMGIYVLHMHDDRIPIKA